MKLEVGKDYNVRSGQGTVRIESIQWGVCKGTYSNGDRSEPGTWQSNGLIYYNGKTSGRDIVSEVNTVSFYGFPYIP